MNKKKKLKTKKKTQKLLRQKEIKLINIIMQNRTLNMKADMKTTSCWKFTSVPIENITNFSIILIFLLNLFYLNLKDRNISLKIFG